MKIITAAVISLAFSCLMPFSLGKVDRYKMSIVGKGTPFLEQIEVDEEQDVEVYRVPAHNNVTAADFYHDFKMGVTVTRVLSRKACYIAKMDPSVSSPKKLKGDLARAASQSSELSTTIQNNLVVVTGPANRLLLTKDILDFCGALAIYKTEVYNDPIEDGNGTITVRAAGRQRRQTAVHVRANTYTSCLASVSHGHQDPLQNVKDGNCWLSHWDLQCQMKHLDRDCYYTVDCKNTKTPTPQQDDVWVCTSTHIFQLEAHCCDYVCPSGNGK
ncbi:hypothetical protein ACROYT_G032381 [Oculina patagonica]